MNRRHLTVKLNYWGRDLSSLLADAQAKIAEQVSFDPDKYSLEWGDSSRTSGVRRRGWR
jgi:cobalt-zinc-cadmium resistance protein CzcA